LFAQLAKLPLNRNYLDLASYESCRSSGPTGPSPTDSDGELR
jgi:hypothetical protein